MSDATPISDAQIEAIARKIEGTCRSLESVIEEVVGEDASYDDITTEQFQRLDAIVLCCDGCQWWYGTPYMKYVGHRALCEECVKDE